MKADIVMIRPTNITTITATSAAITRMQSEEAAVTVVSWGGIELEETFWLAVVTRRGTVALRIGICDDTPFIAATVMPYSTPGLRPALQTV